MVVLERSTSRDSTADLAKTSAPPETTLPVIVIRARVVSRPSVPTVSVPPTAGHIRGNLPFLRVPVLLQVVNVIPFAMIFVNPFRAISNGARIGIWDVNSEGGQWDVVDTRDPSKVLGGHLLPRGIFGVEILSFRRIRQRVPQNRRLVVVQLRGDPIGLSTNLLGRARTVIFPAQEGGL